MSNDYDDYLVDTSSSDDTLLGYNSQKVTQIVVRVILMATNRCALLHSQIYRYDATYNSYSLWRQIVSGTKNKL